MRPHNDFHRYLLLAMVGCIITTLAYLPLMHLQSKSATSIKRSSDSIKWSSKTANRQASIC